MTRKIIVVPCMVRIWLYFSGVSSVLLGTASWVRMSSASMPPSTKNTRTVARYMIPIFLRSFVVTHETQPRASPSARWAMIWGRRSACRPVLTFVSVVAKGSRSFSVALGLLGHEGLLLACGLSLGGLDLLHLVGVPALVVRHLHADHAPEHVRVVTATELGALSVVDDLGLPLLDRVRWDPEPRLVRVAGDGVHLAAELGDPP